MSETDLPTAEEAYGSLRTCGDQFATAPLAPQPLGMTFNHPRKGAVEISVDDRVLSATGRLYVNNPKLATALQVHGVRVGRYEDALRMLHSHLRREHVVWGVSGYASTGFSCENEAVNLEALYDLFSEECKPAFVVDGAAGAGVLGLSGVLATKHNVSTVGITPLQGLSSMAPRSHTIIYGNTYQEREVIVGSIPDALACFGGGEGTLRECLVALSLESDVLLMVPSLTDLWKSNPTVMDAINHGKLVVCKSPKDMREEARRLSAPSRAALQTRRARRLGSLSRLLSP